MDVENIDEMLEQALEGLLRRRPDAQIAAFDLHAVRVPLPSSLGLEERAELPYRALIDLIPQERAAVVALWERARSTGSAVGTARLAGGDLARGYLFDLSGSHGAVVLVLDVLDDDGEHVAMGLAPLDTATPPRPPRLSRVRKNELSVITDVDEATVVGFGWSKEELLGRRTLELIHPDDLDRGVTNWLEMLAAPGMTHRWKGRHRCKDGSYRWVEFVNTNLLDTAEGVVLTEMVDISEEMDAREALVASERLFKGLAEALPIGVAQVDADGEVVFSNEQLARTLGTVAPTSVAQLRDGLAAADRGRFDSHWHALVAQGLSSVAEYELRDGRALEIVARPLDDGGLDGTADGVAAPPAATVAGSGAVLCVSDISDRVLARRDLERRARIDPLTQVLNREAIEAHLALLMADRDADRHSNREGHREGDPVGPSCVGVAVVFIDIDGFKRVNDELGHAVGDVMLTEVGDRLRSEVRARGDQVGRIGGDEFIVVCADVSDAAEARAVRDRIDHRLNRSPASSGDALLRASVGVAWSDDPGVGPLELVRCADEDMYRVKRSRVRV